MSIDCDVEGCRGRAYYYISLDGFDLAGYFACSHDGLEVKRRLSLMNMGKVAIHVQTVDSLFPLQIEAIQANREGKG